MQEIKIRPFFKMFIILIGSTLTVSVLFYLFGGSIDKDLKIIGTILLIWSIVLLAGVLIVYSTKLTPQINISLSGIYYIRKNISVTFGEIEQAEYILPNKKGIKNFFKLTFKNLYISPQNTKDCVPGIIKLRTKDGKILEIAAGIKTYEKINKTFNIKISIVEKFSF